MLRVRKALWSFQRELAGQAQDTGTVSLRKRHSAFPETEGWESRQCQRHWGLGSVFQAEGTLSDLSE